MGTHIDLTGRKFGRWTVVAFAGRRGNIPTGQSLWECECECGQKKTVLYSSLMSGRSNSCGCIRKEGLRARATHGKSKSSEYAIWSAIKTRCLNVKHPSYARYGGKGITIDPRWLGKEGFDRFFADLGPRKNARMIIERKDMTKGYSKENCRWATRAEAALTKY